MDGSAGCVSLEALEIQRLRYHTLADEGDVAVDQGGKGVDRIEIRSSPVPVAHPGAARRLFHDREGTDDDIGSGDCTAEILIGKQRNGMTGTFKLTFSRRITKFMNTEM